MEQTNTPKSPNQPILKIVKYILAVLFIISVIANFSQGNFVAGLIFLILGVLLLPPISEQIKEKFKLWQRKGIRYVAYIVLFFVGATFIGKNGVSKPKNNSVAQEEKKAEPYQEYFNQVQKNTAQLSQERKQEREKILNDLKSNPIYQKLVINKEVSAEYLSLLSAISSGISTISKDGFSIDEKLTKKISSLVNGEQKMSFVTKIIAMSIPEMNGGLTPEIVQMFDRYREKFKSYGESSLMYDMNKNQTKVDAFDLTPFFTMVEPKNKEFLNQFYEAKQKGLSNWNEKGSYTYPFLATKDGYISYIKEVNPESPYIPKVDLEITASELYRAYEANEVSADEQYKGKRMAITGTIGMIGKDVLDNPYVSFRIDYLQGVNCYFSDENNKIISQLSKGQKVTIIGTCSGLTLTDVVIKDCEIWE